MQQSLIGLQQKLGDFCFLFFRKKKKKRFIFSFSLYLAETVTSSLLFRKVNQFLRSYTKLSCNVRTSGRLGNLLISFKGECADLHSHENQLCTLVQTI
jgi:hypothetical protein